MAKKKLILKRKTINLQRLMDPKPLRSRGGDRFV